MNSSRIKSKGIFILPGPKLCKSCGIGNGSGAIHNPREQNLKSEVKIWDISIWGHCGKIEKIRNVKKIMLHNPPQTDPFYFEVQKK